MTPQPHNTCLLCFVLCRFLTLPGVAVYALVRQYRGVGDNAAWERDFDAHLRKLNLNIDSKDWEGSSRDRTALHWACFFNDPAACRFLLSRGVDVNAKTCVSYCPNDCVYDESYYSDDGQVQVINLDEGRTKEIDCATALIVASNMGSLEMVELLLDAKADARVESPLMLQSTSLSFALENRHYDVMFPLMRAGAGYDAEKGWWDADFVFVDALAIGAPHEVVFEMVCRGVFLGFCANVMTSESPVRFAALARAIGFEEDFSADITEALEAPGAKAEVAQLSEQWKADFARYREQFEAEKSLGQ